MSSSKSDDKSSKKLKQACLPFKLVNSPGDDANSKSRKRKLSGTENDETRVENPKIELINGGTKCFIKSDDENKNNTGVIKKLLNNMLINNSLFYLNIFHLIIDIYTLPI